MSNFIPTDDWKDVHADDVLPPGCEIRMSMSIPGGVQARRMQQRKHPLARKNGKPEREPSRRGWLIVFAVLVILTGFSVPDLIEWVMSWLR